MATNFRIFLDRNSDSIHFKLMGDFDGRSAHELLYSIKRHRKEKERLFLHTSSLDEVHISGRALFQTKFSDVVKSGLHNIIITGDKINL